MTYIGDDFDAVQLELSEGVDGLNNIADLEDKFVLDARNVDLSSPGYIEKRAGYHLFGCKLPVRVKSTAYTYNAGTLTNVLLKLDFVPKFERTIQMWLNDVTSNSDYGDARYRQTSNPLETVFVRIKDYATNPNTNPITTNTILEIAGTTQNCTPIAVFDNNTFLIPRIAVAGFAILTGAGAAVEKACKFSEGPSFKSIEESDISDLTVVANDAYITTNVDVSLLGIRQYALVKFETGLTNGVATSRYGYVTIAINNNITVALSAVPSIDGVLPITHFKMLYANGPNFYYDSNFLDFTTPEITPITGLARQLTSCNTLTLGSGFTVLAGPSSSPVPRTSTNIGFLYGTDIDVPKVNQIAYYYDQSVQRNMMLCGYDGNTFVETDPDTTVYQTKTTNKLAAQVLTASAGFVNITVVSTAIYRVGDTVHLKFSDDTTWEQLDYELTVTQLTTAVTLKCALVDTFTTLTVPKNAVLPFTRTYSVIEFTKASYDDTPLVFPGSTLIPFVNGRFGVTSRVLSVRQISTTVTAIVANTITWTSDSYVKTGSIFKTAELADSSTLENYEPITPAYYPNSSVDLSSALIERTPYIAAQKNGIYRFNGAELINMYLPQPPPPLLSNIPGSAGNLLILTDSEGERLGAFYSIVVSYSYFEFTNGILREVESGLTSPDTAILRAQPALDGTFNSQLMEVQVKSIPRGIGLPADTMYINIYRTLDGTVDGFRDGQLFYREATIANDPDSPYTIGYAGSLSSFILERNGKKSELSLLAGDGKNEFGRNKIAPPLANHVINFQNRLIAMNGREAPYFEIIARRVFDSDGTFAGEGGFKFASADSTIESYFFSLVGVDSTTTTTSVTALGETVNTQVFSAQTYDVDAVTYADTSHQFQVVSTTIIPAIATGAKVLLRSVFRDTLDTDYNGFKVDDQVFIASDVNAGTPGDPHVFDAEKKWEDASLVGGYSTGMLANDYMVFVASESVTAASTLGFHCLNSATGDGIQLLSSTAGAGAYDGKFIIIRGIGTDAQMRDENDADKRIYDFDTEVVFLAAGAAADYVLTPYKITGITTAGIASLVAIKYAVDVEISNTVTGADAGHSGLEVYVTADSASTYATVQIYALSVPEIEATFNIPVGVPDLGLVAGDYVYFDGVPAYPKTQKLPNEEGIDFNKALKVVSYTYAGALVDDTLVVEIEPPKNIFPNFTSKTISGKFMPDNLLDFTSTYFEIGFDGSEATAFPLEFEQWVYVIAKTSDNLKHSLQISGWFQIYQIAYTASGNWQSTAPVGVNLFGFRLLANGSKIDKTTLIGLVDIKIIASRGNGILVNDPRQYVPVPCPTSLTTDITGTMFGPLDGNTPYERITKRLGNAISAVMASEGFGYWGANQQEDFIPPSGVRFVNHKWPNNRYKYARSTLTALFDANTYSLTWDLPADYYEINGASGKVLSDGTTQTDDYIENQYPNRIWWTTPQDIAFRELSRIDVSSEVGEEIVGAVPFEEYFLVFSDSQIFKCKLSETGLIQDRVQARVGAVSKKNIVPADSGCMFLSKTGFFFTDGNTVKKIVRLNRVFNDYAKLNIGYFVTSCGVYDPTNYIIRLGAPIADTVNGLYTSNDRHMQLNFNRSQDPAGGVSGGGWSLSTNVPANMWIHYDDKTYFGASYGSVFRIRDEFEKSRFRDDESAIPMQIDTRFYDFGAPDSEKFTRELVLQLDTKFDNGISISSTWDFRKTYHTVGSFTLDASALAAESIGPRYAVSAKYLESRRQTVDPMRATQLGFRLVNSTIDEGGGIHGVWAHVKKIGPKPIRQR